MIGVIVSSLLVITQTACVVPEEAISKGNIIGLYGGYEVEPHSIPFQALLESSDEYGDILCSGALISTNYVLTSAYCVYDLDNVTVYLGVHNRSEIDSSVQTFVATELTYHADYGFEGDYIVNDIGLIKLPEPAVLTSTVQLASLITRADYESNPNQGDINVTISGWGRIGYDDEYSDVLLAGQRYISPIEECASSDSLQLDQYICFPFKKDGTDVEGETGDTGDPLFKSVNGNRYIVALLSTVETDDFEADTNVGYYLDWIESNSDVKIN
ncbi:brachyurin-like [Rhynchophorus ferrugineus]|uniref:brachyurin-like n=1 Tax=Rhynchophorus ferrugineus TaxID=354439 RepID=UPI003FCC95F1